MGAGIPGDAEGGAQAVIAFTGAFGILAAYIIAGWIGYQLGIERGIEKERTKRGIRRG